MIELLENLVDVKSELRELRSEVSRLRAEKEEWLLEKAELKGDVKFLRTRNTSLIEQLLSYMPQKQRHVLDDEFSGFGGVL